MYGRGYVIITSVDGHNVAVPRLTQRIAERVGVLLSTWPATNLLRLDGAFVAR